MRVPEGHRGVLLRWTMTPQNPIWGSEQLLKPQQLDDILNWLFRHYHLNTSGTHQNPAESIRNLKAPTWFCF